MTGYGKAYFKDKKQIIGIEISSVNNRFLEYAIRLPRELGSLELKIKELIGTKIQRGKININIAFEESGSVAGNLVLNKPLTKEIYYHLKALKKEYKLEGDIDINHFLSFPDILKVEKCNNIGEQIWPQLKKTINKALSELLSMRLREGANLKKDITVRTKKLLADIAKIEKLSVINRQIHNERLTKKLGELLNRNVVNDSRLEEEIAYLVERSDITEECVRFRSHVRQFQSAIKQTGPVGKKMNFILQELNRESNTIGSKAANNEIASITVEIKEGVEQIREQIQNIE